MAIATIGTMASAQSFNYLSTEQDPYLAGICISENGKYIGGMDYSLCMFLSDWAKDNTLIYDEPNGDTGCCIRSISNEGKGVGFNGDNAIVYDINGNYQELPGKEAIAESVTPDGSFICGAINTNSIPQPVYWTGGNYVELPMPTADECDITINGANAKYVNADASIIAGHIVDKFSTRPLVLWRRGADGTYTVDPVFKKYCTDKTEDGKGLACIFNATALSKNGRWAAITVSEGMSKRIARYDIENDKLEKLNYIDEDGETPLCISSGIANDGTILGYTDNDESDVRRALICKPGGTNLQPLSKAFSSLAELEYFDDLDTHYNIACDISADGKYILGHAMDIVPYGDSEAEIFVTYVINTDKDATAIKSVTTKGTNGKTTFYSVDGKHINPDFFHGIMIEKDAMGNTKKIIK